MVVIKTVAFLQIIFHDRRAFQPDDFYAPLRPNYSVRRHAYNRSTSNATTEAGMSE